MEELVPSIELCRSLYAKYPRQKSFFNWYIYSGCSVGGGEMRTSNSKNNKMVAGKNYMELGFNLGKLSYVNEIIPAYTMQDIIELYEGSERIKTVTQLAELLTS